MIEAIRQAVGEVIYERYGESIHSAQTVFLTVETLKKLLNKEFGVMDIDGNIVWFLDDDVVGAKPGDSLKDAKSYLSTFDYDDEGMKLVSRLVTKGKEVKR